MTDLARQRLEIGHEMLVGIVSGFLFLGQFLCAHMVPLMHRSDQQIADKAQSQQPGQNIHGQADTHEYN